VNLQLFKVQKALQKGKEWWFGGWKGVET